MTTPAAVRLPIPGGLSMALDFLQAGQRAAVVLGVETPDGAGLTEAKAIEWRDAAWAAFKPYMVNTVSLVGAKVRFAVPDSQVIELGPPAANVGTNTQGQAIAAACWLLKWTTLQGGRSGKGRTFLPGLPASQINANGRQYEASAPANATTMINAYLNASVFTDTFRPAVLSYRRGEAYRITGGALAPVVGLQRRRMR